MIFLEDDFSPEEYRSLLATADVEARACDTADRGPGGRFGDGNDCAASDGGTATAKDDGSWRGKSGRVAWGKDEDSAGEPPVRGGDKIAKLVVQDAEALSDSMDNVGVDTLDDLMTLGGGDVRGASVIVSPYDEQSISIEASIPVNSDGSPEGGYIDTSSEIVIDDEGSKQLFFGELIPDVDATRDENLEKSPAKQAKIASIMMEKFLDAMVKADEMGFDSASMAAVGNANSAMKGYRLWPQFGFDARLRPELIADIPPEVMKTVKRVTTNSKLSKSYLTLQELISSREGERWWDENGSGQDMKFDFKDKNGPGRKRFEEMKSKLKVLRRRNKGRSLEAWLDGLVESRDANCGRTPDGQFAPKNDCAGDGDGSGQAATKSKSAKKSEPQQEPLKWSPGTPHVDVFKESHTSNPTKKSDDGRKVISTSIPGAQIGKGPGGRTEVDPISVGRYLSQRQYEHRGRMISTDDKLSDADFEYIVSGIASQVESARSRGVAPNFYSPEDRKRQLREYARIHPVLLGGRTASGLCLGEETPDGDCKPGSDITPEAEFLFRAVQALTSPEANPFENMLRADKVLTRFFENPDPESAKLGHGVSIAGAAGNNTVQNLKRLQKIIDRIGLPETVRLFNGPPLRVKDFDKYFSDRVPGTKGDRYTASNYAVDEVVPLFSIFGPKVGPFFANNMGHIEALTADIWFTRTWGRLSGELVIDTSKALSRKYGTEMMPLTKHLKARDLKWAGIGGRELRTALAQMKQTGVPSSAIVAWAEGRHKQYKKDGYPPRESGEEDWLLNKLAGRILKNQTDTLDTPRSRAMRSNMIKVMREASRRTGVPVAYMQDILWQDEQDAWGTLGSRTTTEPGVPSLYSDVIKKIADNPHYRERRLSTRSAGSVEEPREYEYLSSQKGGIEQSLYDEFLSGLTDDEFADLAIALLSRNAEPEEESRSADCGRDEGGRFGSGNDCAADGTVSLDVPDSSRVVSHTMPKSQYDDPKNRDAWLNPSGEFHPVPKATFTTHESWAMSHGVGGGESQLFGSGWMRVTHSGRTLYLHSTWGGPSRQQVAAAVDHAIATGKYDEVVADGGWPKGKKAVWSRSTTAASSESRSGDSDCGRDEGGRFGSGNDCAADGTSTATQDAPFGDKSKSNATLSWSGDEDGDPPFSGAEQLKSVRVSAPAEVSKSLSAVGMTPEAAIASVGGNSSEPPHVFMRPATEFAEDSPFKGSGVVPVFIDVEKDVAGVENGMSSSSVVGIRATASGQQLVIYHSTAVVTDAVRNDDSKRHAAAREFYRTMTASVENARKNGVAYITLNAAGHSASESKGKANPWRGYTIWPRMGFDAPLPPHIVRTLPPELSHARSLLDLHATPEGTRWWAKNGEDLDVSIDLRDRGSPQNKVMDRFIRKFASERREMPLGAGDDWMSPEDLMRLDEMWQEIWDEGDLDDYEYKPDEE